jgi:hypothetical protein
MRERASRTSSLLWHLLRTASGLEIEVDADADGSEHANPDPDLARNDGQQHQQSQDDCTDASTRS